VSGGAGRGIVRGMSGFSHVPRALAAALAAVFAAVFAGGCGKPVLFDTRGVPADALAVARVNFPDGMTPALAEGVRARTGGCVPDAVRTVAAAAAAAGGAGGVRGATLALFEVSDAAGVGAPIWVCVCAGEFSSEAFRREVAGNDKIAATGGGETGFHVLDAGGNAPGSGVCAVALPAPETLIALWSDAPLSSGRLQAACQRVANAFAGAEAPFAIPDELRELAAKHVRAGRAPAALFFARRDGLPARLRAAAGQHGAPIPVEALGVASCDGAALRAVVRARFANTGDAESMRNYVQLGLGYAKVHSARLTRRHPTLAAGALDAAIRTASVWQKDKWLDVSGAIDAAALAGALSPVSAAP